MNIILSPLIALLITTFSASFSFASTSFNYFCCISSALDDQNNIYHTGKSRYCVKNNSEELIEVRPSIFRIVKYAYTFQIDLNVNRLQSISITKPNGAIQTGPEREILKGRMWDLFIGTFGEPQYQYFSEAAGEFILSCLKK